MRNLILFSSLILTGLIGCSAATNQTAKDIYCNVYSVNVSGEPTGTAFSVVDRGLAYIVTAAHVLPSNKKQQLSLKSCSNSLIEVKNSALIPRLDLALLFVKESSVKSGFELITSETQWGDQIEAPNYSSFDNAANKLKGKLIPACGKVIGYEDSTIFITLDIVQKGGSGAPILDASGQVIGLLTNRVNVEGKYSGVSYGIDARAIETAIRDFSDADHQ